MLPNALYKSLPYIYIISGVFFGVVVKSNIVFISSALLMMAGFIVLWMRHHPLKHGITEPAPTMKNLKARSWNDIFQAEQERRLSGIVRTFPLIDNSGNVIAFDRRVSVLRESDAA